MASVDQDLSYLENEIDALKRQNPKGAVEFFNLLIKAVKAKLVYPASSRLPAQFRDEFAQKGKTIITESDGLSFKVNSSSIIYENTPVYESNSRAENVAHIFFRDGLTGLHFQSDINIEELGKFVDLLANMMRTVYVDDDMATLLWEENFNHITYDLIDDGLEIETFEYSTNKYMPGITASSTDIEAYFVNEGQMTFDENDFSPENTRGILEPRSQAYSTLPEKSHQFLNQITEFTQDEKTQIAEILASDADFNHTDYLITIVFEMLGLEKEINGYVEILGFIGGVLDSFITSGNFMGALSLATKMHELAGVLRNLKNPRAEKIDAFLFDCASKEKIASLTNTLNNLKEVDTINLVEYLKHLPWAAIDPLITGLGELNEYKTRQAICDVLRIQGHDHIELLARGLEDEKWYVVRNVVTILGDMNNPKTINYLKRTIRHPDYRVRYETLKAVARIQAEESADFMILALSDPDSKIQQASLKLLVEKKCKRAIMAIENIIKDKGFKNKQPEQMREIIEAYAELGQAKAFPYIKSLLSKKILFGSTMDDRMRLYAVGALAKIDLMDAYTQLTKLASSKETKVASAATRAMQHMKVSK